MLCVFVYCRFFVVDFHDLNTCAALPVFSNFHLTTVYGFYGSTDTEKAFGFVKFSLMVGDELGCFIFPLLLCVYSFINYCSFVFICM